MKPRHFRRLQGKQTEVRRVKVVLHMSRPAELGSCRLCCFDTSLEAYCRRMPLPVARQLLPCGKSRMQADLMTL